MTNASASSPASAIRDGSLLVFETWSYTPQRRTFVVAHRRLWRIIDDRTPRIAGSRLPADTTNPVAVDSGRIILLAKHGLAVLNASA